MLLAADPASRHDEPTPPQTLPVTRAEAQPTDFDTSDEAWLRLVQLHGGEAGLGALAGRTFRTSSGRIYVPVEQDRIAILALKRDPAIGTRIATAAARADSGRLERVLARRISLGELYMAHCVGADAATAILQAAAYQPGKPASEVAPTTALEYPEAFFQGTNARTVEQVAAFYAGSIAKTLQKMRHPLAISRPKPPSGVRPWITSVMPTQQSRQMAAAR